MNIIQVESAQHKPDPPEIHIKISFFFAIVIISKWAAQHYINTENHMKNNQRRSYIMIHFETCQVILVKTFARYLWIWNHSVCAQMLSRHFTARTFDEMDLVTLKRNDVAFNESANVCAPVCSWFPGRQLKREFIVLVYISMRVPGKSGNFELCKSAAKNAASVLNLPHCYERTARGGCSQKPWK